jgi:ketosteroid isomerase-like protein
MDAIQRLLTIEEIKQLKARYFRCVDARDWEGYRAVFADDVLFDISQDMPEGGIVHGGEEAAAIARKHLTSDVVSVHHGHCPEIEITSETTAKGIWAMEDKLYWTRESGFPISRLHGMGHYRETYTKKDGHWRIQTMKLTRIRVDTWGWE